jgi:flagellin
MVNNAEGALGLILDPNLIRIRDLAIQAANDTLTEYDRTLIQREIEQIKKGINNIAKNTEFNTINLLAPGEIKTVTPGNTTASEIDIVFVIDNTGSMGPIQKNVANNIGSFINALGSYGITDFRIGTMEYTDNEFNISSFSGGIWTTDPLELQTELNNYAANNRGGVEDVLTAVTTAIGTYDFRSSTTGGQSKHIIIVTNEDADDEQFFNDTMLAITTNEIRVHAVYNPGGENGSSPVDEIGAMANGTGGSTVNISFPDWGSLLVDRIAENIGSSSTTTTTETELGNLILHVGSDENQILPIELFDARVTNLGINDVDVMHPQYLAERAIGLVDNAMQLVSEQRAKFGTYATRLEHIYENLSVGEVNVSSAESLIRDTDMAKTMMSFTKNNIIAQASQAMLAQANVLAPQSLKLLTS